MRKVTPLADRFWAKVDKSETCWLWTGAKVQSGYGTINLGGRELGNAYAHRLAYEMLVGPIPDGKFLDHKCRNRLCVNPDHLQPATVKANAENLSGAHRDSATGVRGVYYDKRRDAFVVSVFSDGRYYYGKQHKTLAEAEAAAIALRNRVMTNNLADRTAS